MHWALLTTAPILLPKIVLLTNTLASLGHTNYSQSYRPKSPVWWLKRITP